MVVDPALQTGIWLYVDDLEVAVDGLLAGPVAATALDCLISVFDQHWEAEVSAKKSVAVGSSPPQAASSNDNALASTMSKPSFRVMSTLPDRFSPTVRHCVGEFYSIPQFLAPYAAGRRRVSCAAQLLDAVVEVRVDHGVAGVATLGHGVLALPHTLDLLPRHLAQQRDAPIREAEVLRWSGWRWSPGSPKPCDSAGSRGAW